jgi:hypothetical protein
MLPTFNISAASDWKDQLTYLTFSAMPELRKPGGNPGLLPTR